MKNKIGLAVLLLWTAHLSSQNIVPSVYTNIQSKAKQGIVYSYNGTDINEAGTEQTAFYNLAHLMGDPKGTGTGFSFDFNDKSFSGRLYYGFVNYKDYKHPQPVYFKRTADIISGHAQIDMRILSGKYDMIGWEQSKRGDLAYRVVDHLGQILYDGIIAFEKKQAFEVLPTIVEGPILSCLTDSSVVVRFKTNYDAFCSIEAEGNVFKELNPSQDHEIVLHNLQANQAYNYTINCAGNAYTYDFKTAPRNGSKTPFTFAYASDSRAGIGGGERNIYGTNAYIIKKSFALAVQQNVAFMQFTGDMINGYSNDVQTTKLQYANFKHVISPFAAYMPFNVGIGNHEVVEYHFPIEGEYGIHIDRFPFETESMEAIFAKEFANPKNGLYSEDGASYDPNLNQIDFPSYQENVYHYTYGNVAVVVLNSEYLYTPSLEYHPETSGGLHGYMMDGQLKWLEETILEFENDENIDHVFVTQHTPAFPNGGHVGDAMWYNGNNELRTIIAGNKMKRGVIEQRDLYLDIIINRSSKVAAIFTGDEHNYCKTFINKDMEMYPKDWKLPKLELKRSVYQINNGACGAPYYAQEETPWSKYTSGFSTQNALVLVDVDAEHIKVRVLNPDTLEEIESYTLK